MKRVFNYKFSQPDPRDLNYHRSFMAPSRRIELPPQVDLTKYKFYPPVIDQKDIGSCTAASACAVKDFITRRYKPNHPTSSILGFYFSERMAGNTVMVDSGSDGRTSGQVMMDLGVGSERLWPYQRPNLFKRPSPQYFEEAAENRIGAFYFLHGHDQMKHCLALGYPFVFGTTCTKKMCDDNFDGWIRSYKVDDVLIEDGEVAGHQMSVFGYQYFDGELFYLVRQSFGTDYGLKEKPGHFWLTGDMFLDRAWIDDLITFRLARESLF